MRKASVPARVEGNAQAAEIIVQQGLEARTLAKLGALFENKPEDISFEEMPDAQAVVREALREAHCDETLHNVHWWDLSGASRIIADNVSIPAATPPRPGDVLTYNNRTYYIASVKA